MTPIPWRSSPGAWPARCGDLLRCPKTSTSSSNVPTRCTWPTSPEASLRWRSADRRLGLERKKGGERIRAGVTLSQRRRLIVAMWARMWAGLTALLVVAVVASLLTGVLTPVQASSPQLLTASPQAQVAQKPKVVLKLLAITDDAQIKPPATLGKSWTMAEALRAWQKTTIRPSGSSVPSVWGLRWGQGTWVGDYEHGIFRRSNGAKGSPTYNGVGDDGITFVGYMDTPE